MKFAVTIELTGDDGVDRLTIMHHLAWISDEIAEHGARAMRVTEGVDDPGLPARVEYGITGTLPAGRTAAHADVPEPRDVEPGVRQFVHPHYPGCTVTMTSDVGTGRVTTIHVTGSDQQQVEACRAAMEFANELMQPARVRNVSPMGGVRG